MKKYPFQIAYHNSTMNFTLLFTLITTVVLSTEPTASLAPSTGQYAGQSTNPLLDLPANVTRHRRYASESLQRQIHKQVHLLAEREVAFDSYSYGDDNFDRSGDSGLNATIVINAGGNVRVECGTAVGMLLVCLYVCFL